MPKKGTAVAAGSASSRSIERSIDSCTAKPALPARWAKRGRKAKAGPRLGSARYNSEPAA